MASRNTMRTTASRRSVSSHRHSAPGYTSIGRPRSVKELAMNSERERMLANVPGRDGWKNWGPYLSERQWGTVREDYSADGTAWEYFPHDHARSRAYRWGEDGIAGVSDADQLVCLSLALWNGADPILKERLFGLTNSEGNHGEDVKEQYFYLDATPSHSYLKMLYKYPQRAYPYAELVAENARRGTGAPEYELLWGIGGGGYYKDGFHERIVGSRQARVNPAKTGTKAAAWHRETIPSGGHCRVRLRLSRGAQRAPFDDFNECLSARRTEADDF